MPPVNPPVPPPVQPPVAVAQPPVAATQPLVVATTRPAATTQPVTDPFAEPGRGRRLVTLIKGGTRSEVMFDAPKNDPHGDEAVTSTHEGEDQE